MQAGNNRAGIMRTVLKDNNDANETSTLDSDGQYNYDSAWPSNATFLNVSNGAWHMATLTTHTDRDHGYAIYIDGKPAGMPFRLSIHPEYLHTSECIGSAC